MFTAEEMRLTILGKVAWIPCPQCSTTGLENWDENGEDVRSGPTSDSERVTGECENCDGLGFISRVAVE